MPQRPRLFCTLGNSDLYYFWLVYDCMKIITRSIWSELWSGRCCLIFLVGFFMTGCGSSGVYIRQPMYEVESTECVILIHGLARTYRSMWNMEKKLRSAGYLTVNLDYPSRSKTIEQIAAEDVSAAIDQCAINNAKVINFVTHSMGGIITRKRIKDNRPDRLGRVVMLSPPNKGSKIADVLKNRWYYHWINGPAGQQLTTAPDSLPNSLGPVDYPVGIITGNDPAFFDTWSTFIPGINDGKIGVEQTKLEGMSDFLIVPESHTYIMDSKRVQDETVHFLKYGFFVQETNKTKEK